MKPKDGAFRDRREADSMGFPIFARTAVPVSARNRVIEDAYGPPVKIAGVTVRPQDFVLADADGVVFIPKDKAREVVRLANEIVENEAQMASAIRARHPASRALGACYESLVRRRSKW